MVQLQPSTTSQGQSSIDSYCSAALERNRAAEAFDYEVFRGILTRMFTMEQIPLHKVDSEYVRDAFMYANPRCNAAIPTRNTMKRYIDSAYDGALTAVESELRLATTKINLSFDLWTSLNRRLSLLGIVTHYLNYRFEPRTVLLVMLRMRGAHTAANLSSQLLTLIQHFNLQTSFGYAITDNASENRACLDLLAKSIHFDTSKRHVLCIGHIINLVAHKVLFGSDVELFEHELESNVTAEVIELDSWRRKGPIGKLHNLIRYIYHSTQRQDAFLSIQSASLDSSRDQSEPRKQPLHLIRDNRTRWNSWYDAAVRAIELRDAIDEFVDTELTEYHQKLSRYERWIQAHPSVKKDSPKAPSLLEDRLDQNDWEVIITYITILKPCKQAIMKLQGNMSTTTICGRTMKGAIWQVLPVFSDLLKGFEEAR
jgi:hypothetical protein